MRRDDAYLLDMLLSARDAVEFVSGITYADFEASRLRQNAVLKSLEIIGEAASRVSTTIRETHGSIPWGDIVALRNRIVHAYFETDIDIVWKVVQEELPTLIVQLERIVPPETNHE